MIKALPERRVMGRQEREVTGEKTGLAKCYNLRGDLKSLETVIRDRSYSIAIFNYKLMLIMELLAMTS